MRDELARLIAYATGKNPVEAYASAKPKEGEAPANGKTVTLPAVPPEANRKASKADKKSKKAKKEKDNASEKDKVAKEA